MNRNELTTLLQLSRGVKIVAVRFIASFPLPDEDEDDKDDFDYMTRVSKSGRTKVDTYNGQPESKARGKVYHYKAVGIGPIEVGDLVTVQVRNSAGVAEVQAVHDYIPTGMEPDRKLRYVLGKVDMHFGKRLEAEEQAILDKLQEAEVKARLADFEKTSGFDISTIATPMVTALAPPVQNVHMVDPVSPPVVEPEAYPEDASEKSQARR